MEDTTIINFFFNARGNDFEKSAVGMYRSLLWQLLDKFPALQTVFESLNPTQKNDDEKQWPIESLKDFFKQVVEGIGSSQKHIACFVDALDECPEDQIRDMISLFRDIGDRASSMDVRFSVCFSSRHYPHITVEHGLELILEGQEGHGQDITNYIEAELKIGKSKQAEKIRAAVKEKSSGIFMWVVLVVAILNKEYDRGRIHSLQKRLQDIPGDLYELFHEILTRDNHGQDELLLLIQWVLFARDPLTPQQLYSVILTAIDDDTPDLDDILSEDIDKFILDSSKGLAEITKSSLRTVQFIHQSVRDFLLEENVIRNIWPQFKSNFEGHSHEQLKTCCQKYARIHTSTTVNPNDELPIASSEEAKQLRNKTISSFPFLEYAVRNVFFHANESGVGGISQREFILNFELHEWIKLNNIFEAHQIRRYKPDTDLLYILTEANAPSLIKLCPELVSCIEKNNERYVCPLLAAIVLGNYTIIEIFREALTTILPPETLLRIQSQLKLQDASKLRWLRCNFEFSEYRSIASYLAEYGDCGLFTLFTQHQNIGLDIKDKLSGKTPLLWAVQRRHKEVVRVLLESDEVDPGASDNEGNTPLLEACLQENKELINILLTIGKVDPNARNSQGRTLLNWAVSNHRNTTIQLLVNFIKVNPDSPDNGGITPLYTVVKYNQEKIARFLLNTGKVNPNSQGNNGRTPLFLAVQNGNEPNIRLLLSNNKIDPDIRDNDGRTPLSWAAQIGNETNIRLLLNSGKVDPDSRDIVGRTPLSRACSSQHARKVVPLLLNTGKVDPDSRDNVGRTPLSWACSSLYEQEAVPLLLDTGKVDPDSRDNVDQTPLSWACTSPCAKKVVLLLLNTGKVNPDSRDRTGRTPLAWAYMNTCDNMEAVLLLLRTSKFDPHSQDHEGLTPMGGF